MSVNSITTQMCQSVLSNLDSNSSTSVSATTQEINDIVSELKYNTDDMNAQQIANKYDISLSDAQKVLDELDTSDTSDTSKQTQNDETSANADADVGYESTVTYHV